jgi:hypothetical protein
MQIFIAGLPGSRPIESLEGVATLGKSSFDVSSDMATTLQQIVVQQRIPKAHGGSERE